MEAEKVKEKENNHRKHHPNKMAHNPTLYHVFENYALMNEIKTNLC